MCKSIHITVVFAVCLNLSYSADLCGLGYLDPFAVRFLMGFCVNMMVLHRHIFLFSFVQIVLIVYFIVFGHIFCLYLVFKCIWLKPISIILGYSQSKVIIGFVHLEYDRRI